MPRPFPVCVLLLLSSLTLPVWGLQIEHQARALQPGEVVLLSLRHPEIIREVSGLAFDRPLHFYQNTEHQTWQALIGIDLETPPGSYPVEVTIQDEEGRTFCQSDLLEISPKDFPTRHLTVEEKYVTPPPEVMERIRRESEEVRRILSEVSAEKLWEGAFARPVPGRVISSFGKRSVLNGKPRSPHSGVDLRAASGTWLRSPAHGKVKLVKELYFAGNAVIIDHGLGLFSYFAHLSSFKVQPGDIVEKGQTVGLTGMTGRVSGPHLHWSVRLGNARVDPLSLLSVLGGEAGTERPVGPSQQ